MGKNEGGETVMEIPEWEANVGVPMIEAVCFDFRDTLVAEETVIHDSSGRTITANVIRGER